MIEFVSIYLRGKVIISDNDYLFKSVQKYNGFYIINARKELRVYITYLASIILVGSLCWISTLLYLIITLLTTN